MTCVARKPYSVTPSVGSLRRKTTRPTLILVDRSAIVPLARPCLDCGVLTTSTLSRCVAHQSAYESARGSSSARGYGRGWRALRLACLRRDGYACVVCGRRSDLTADHVVPLSHGGTNTLDNLQTLCRPHNSSKHNR